jgi:hypothetical protein
MRVFEHCEACPAPCGGGLLTQSMRRVANATLLRFGRYGVASRTAKSDVGLPITQNRFSPIRLKTAHGISCRNEDIASSKTQRFSASP